MKKLSAEQLRVIQVADERGYGDIESLKAGARFYPDEGFEDGIDRNGKTSEEMHPNASGCDTCDDPAQFMTCPEGEDFELYICECCVAKFGLETFVDRQKV